MNTRTARKKTAAEEAEEWERLKRKISGGGSNDPTTKLILTNGASIRPVNVSWAWRHWLQYNAFNLLAGQSTAGKSTVALSFSATITTGGLWPDGTPAQQGCVLFWSGEDGIDDTLLPRFLASGGDPRFIHFIGGVTTNGKKRSFDPSSDMPELAEAARALGNVKMIVLDPVAVVVKGDSHKNTETRVGLQPFADLCMETRACGIGIHHFTKSSAGGHPLDRVSGSLAFHALPRCVLVAAKDQNGGQDARRALMRAKISNGPEYGGFDYRTEQQELIDWPGVVAQRATWGNAIQASAREILATFDGGKQGKEITLGTQAMQFLEQALKDGPRQASELIAEASLVGIPERTLRNARNALGCTFRREGFGGPLVWELPEAAF
jgi:putative DNA primase/helicase